VPARFDLRPAAAKDLQRISRPDRERILAAIEGLPAGDVKRLTGRPGEYRLRVGMWRVLFELAEGDAIVVYRIAPRVPPTSPELVGPAAKSPREC
jgi:mRNA interferase RelE/StbE